MQEAELVLDVLRRSEGAGEGLGDIGTGTYRLLFRVLASHPEEVRAFYEDTVAPIVRYDDQYRTDLAATLEAYLEQNCNMNATAAAIFAHRHTVAYRLDRVKELTASTPRSPRIASGSGWGSRRTGSSRRRCRAEDLPQALVAAADSDGPYSAATDARAGALRRRPSSGRRRCRAGGG